MKDTAHPSRRLRESVTQLNLARREAIARAAYDPVAGNPADPLRVRVVRGADVWYLPRAMTADICYAVTLPDRDFDMLRFRHDFEFWAARCVRITDKVSKQVIPFILNRPQRRLLAELEEQRRAGVPVRLIILKARQWGASTLVQIYFAWLQIVHLRNWHSLICAHLKDAAANIRGMYSRLLANYPREYWDEETAPEFRPFERSVNVRMIPGRGCHVTVCSSENQESARGMDCSMAHLSEVAFWKDTLRHDPLDLIRSVTSGIARAPMTVVVMESTANGVGNFFNKEWERAVAGKSDKTPFFVPWYEIDLYSEPLADPEAFFATLDPYERGLWDTHGCTLEAIKWYRHKLSEYADRRSMMAEFPTTPEEAFCATGASVFSSADVARLRRAGCSAPFETGEVLGSPCGALHDISRPCFSPSPAGLAKVWTRPRGGASYIVSVDIGGRTVHADYSVITVLDRHISEPVPAIPEVVAQWRGHVDHDILAWRAAAMGRWYNDALLVVESNSWETSSDGHGRYILDTLADAYPNMYRRPGDNPSSPGLPGFHTNARSKAAVIANMIVQVRDGGYTERDHDACDELLQYESLPDGTCAARRGCHDDILMSRAIALHIHSAELTSVPPLTPRDLAAILGQ